MKNLVKSLIFIFIFIILFVVVSRIFKIAPNPITDFYKEPKNSLDVVYIGASNAYIHFNPTLAYKEYGFATGMFSFDSQPFLAAEYMIKESEKYQKPKLYVIDISTSESSFSDLNDGQIRKTTDSLKFSKIRNELIDKILSFQNISKDDYINYYFSFLYYHDLWKWPINIFYNLFGSPMYYKGYNFEKKTSGKISLENLEWNNDISPLNKENKEVLESLLNYIKSKKINVLFVVSKRSYEKEEMSQINDAIRIIKNEGLDIINFNELDDFKVDLENDYYDIKHFNVYGSTKFTLYFSKYLSENYNLENHSGDKKYSSWDKEYKRFTQDFKKITNYNFEELVNNYKELGY